MNLTWDRAREARDGNYPEIRGRLIDLIRKGRRWSAFTSYRPTEIRPWEIVHPETGLPLPRSSVWTVVEGFLGSGVPPRRIGLRQPPGEVAWGFRARMSSESATVYVKLQLFGSKVLLRSFHEAEYDD